MTHKDTKHTSLWKRIGKQKTWWIAWIAIIITIVLNKYTKVWLPPIDSEKYSIAWFAAKIPYTALRLFFTFLLAYFVIGFKNIKGWCRFRWYFLIFIPLFYYLVRPSITNYAALEWQTTAQALLAMLIGVTQEELFSRGIVYTHIKEKTNALAAILLSSVVFGVLHHSFSGVGAFSIDAIMSDAFFPFIIGLFLATFYHFSKSLPLVIIMHFIWNTVSMILMTNQR